MTSQKSSKSNVNLKDFLRSLSGSILFPAIAFAVLTIVFAIPVLMFFLSQDFRSQMVHEEVSMFITERMSYMVEPTLIPIGMVLCGMMTAMKSFMFQMKKNQTNVYFCFGLKRTTLYLNRTFAGFLLLFLAVLIPMTLTYIFNIAFIGISAHLTQIYLYLVFLLTISGFAGFAIGAFASTISGNFIEGALTAGTTSLLPFMLISTFYSLRSTFLRGFTYSSEGYLGKLLNPFTFGFDMNAQEQHSFDFGDVNTYYYPLRSLCQTLTRNGATPDKYKVPEELVIDMGWLLPIIIWVALSIVFIALGLVLFNRRRAEHANSLGKFKLSTAINATTFTVFGASLIIDAMPNQFTYVAERSGGIKENTLFWLIILFVATFVIYFLSQLILTRKIKRTLKSLSLYGVIACVMIFGLVAVNTEYFGTYNKLPETAEIKSVQFGASFGPFFNSIMPMSEASQDGTYHVIESSDANDIKAAEKLFNMISNDKKTKEGPISELAFLINTKDGKVMQRRLPVYSEETLIEYKRIATETDYFDKLLADYLIVDHKKADDENSDVPNFNDTMSESDSYKEAEWKYFDSSLLSSTTSMVGNEYQPNYQGLAVVNDSVGLCKALYDDLSKMNYDALERNLQHPLGAVAINETYTLSSEYLMKDGENIEVNDHYGYYYTESYEGRKTPISQDVVTTGSCIYIYPEMTNTIKFLEAQNLMNTKTYEGKIKEILYTDSTTYYGKPVFKLLSEFYNSEDAFRHIFNGPPTIFTIGASISANIADGAKNIMADNSDAKIEDYLKKAYNEYGHPLMSVKDADKINAIYNKTVPYFATVGDKGRYAYVIYENGPIVCYYLPEANLGVLK